MTSATGTPDLLDLLLDRIGSSDLSDVAQLIVLAAYQGQAELDQALQGAVQGERPPEVHRTQPDVPRNYLKAIEVTGFRGVGTTAALRLQPGPGLTLVVGRNGSGKSSFAEAAEVGLTGTNARWSGRGVVWKEGWRNLHLTDAQPSVAVELSVDGDGGGTRVVRSWDTDDVDESTGWCQRSGEPRRPIEQLGWEAALKSFRPFLSYSELGSMLLGKPSELHDALFSILGLDAVSSAQQRIKDVQRALDDRAKAMAAEQKRLAVAVGDMQDARAQRAAVALRGRAPDVGVIEEVVRATPAEVESLVPLQLWVGIRPPDPGAADAAADELESAAARAAGMAGTESGRARDLAALLEQALTHAAHSPSRDCPVCENSGALDDAWAGRTRGHIEHLREVAFEADAAQSALRRAWTAVESAAPLPPASLAALPDAAKGDGDILELWRTWASLVRGGDVSVTLEALRERTADLHEGLKVAQRCAEDELARRQDVWQPMAEGLAAFLVEARAVAGEAVLRGHAKEAGEWLKGQADGLRDDRLAPIGEQAGRIWQQLKQESNVVLGPVKLEGAATRRRVTLDVTVDGVEGAALGVMSQGELHALALSLFLPRAMLAESPFRFLVIDDPVQAMDPSKVDGLARVLEDVARTHQVVVFTHDDRLPEAVRRLQLPATIWQVVRREGSQVELQKVADPASRYLEDARALAKSTDLPRSVAGRVVPGLCRGALEAVAHELIRRRRLESGIRHADVEDVIRNAKTTTQVFSLALFDDGSRGGEVMGRLNTLGRGRWAADVFQAVKKGVHNPYAGDLEALVKDSERLVQLLRS